MICCIFWKKKIFEKNYPACKELIMLLLMRWVAAVHSSSLVLVPCPALASTVGGSSITSTDGTVTKVEFTCDVGYTISGKTTLTCLKTGDWDNTQPTCGEHTWAWSYFGITRTNSRTHVYLMVDRCLVEPLPCSLCHDYRNPKIRMTQAGT